MFFIDLFLLLTLQEGRACRATTRCTGTRYSAAPTAPRCGSSSRSFSTYRDSLCSVITRSLQNKIVIDSWAFLFLSLQLTAHFHPSVSLFAKTILQVEHLVITPQVTWLVPFCEVALLKTCVVSTGGRRRVLWRPAAGLHPHPLPGPLCLQEPQTAEGET